MAEERGMTRRHVLRLGMFSALGLMSGTTLGAALAMLGPTKEVGFGAPIQVPKKADEIRPGEVVPVREGQFYLTRTADGFMALHWRCVHLGCTAAWVESEQRFVCPCHGAQYTITGQNVAGPAPRPLDTMPLMIAADGTITVDTGTIRQRSAYEPGQAVRPPGAQG